MRLDGGFMQPSDACSWYPHRFNVVAFGIVGYHMASKFVDSLDEALATRLAMEHDGAEDVRVYDTVDGIFY
jgi:hypothetical protein